MSKFVATCALLGAMACGWAVCAATMQDKKVVFVDSSKCEWKPFAPGASISVVQGDPEKGKSCGFIKMDPGAKFDMHTHTADMRLVVIKGAYLYKSKSGTEHRVGPGCAIALPGGDVHWSGSDEKEGVLFFQETDGKFDLVPEKK